ncbi:isochorismatase family cysteine hydrolase [Variovorax sp.]|jgi:nicotinamidase-related amidase|uniref:isochorismatase family cysteine hydrolase n=1 Tax=unclassified Variovorax TaxID=663243 RepID=UPI001228758F|nr:isochorismatase family cysteine hydrolase [Variovorax sp.]TAJ64696.1 MAG: cysteine hydrolase [Variovorax sp.]
MPSRTSGLLASESAAGHTALLIIDMINCWDFPDADKLLPGAASIAPRIAALKARCRRDGVPVIYANDNRGRWRSDFPALVEEALRQGGLGSKIAAALKPEADDYFVLKPKQSAFFGTPLELLLQHLKAHRLILTGVASDQCVLVTATEAGMRDLAVVVPRDCVASQSRMRNMLVLRQLEEFQKLPTTPSTRLRLISGPRRA